LDEAATLLVEARAVLADGDREKAVELLTSSVAQRPEPWAYFERAKIYAEDGLDEQAAADVDAGLALDAEHPDLLWLQGQLKKSPKSRFKGKSRQPPQASK
jgi:tetratricopeptide (TPR) repeat protein